MLSEELTQDTHYQRAMIRYQQVYEQLMERLGRDEANDRALSEALDLQMVRLQLAELHWQLDVIRQSPLQLAAAFDKTMQCLRHSRALIEDAVRTNEEFHRQIGRTQATIAESQRLLAGLGQPS